MKRPLGLIVLVLIVTDRFETGSCSYEHLASLSENAIKQYRIAGYFKAADSAGFVSRTAMPKYGFGACQLTVFSDKLPSMEAEIDCKLQSNSR